MIGKPEWFTYRRFGWGIAPKTWQGWVYIGVFIAIILGISGSATFLPESIIIRMMIFVVAILVLDTFHIMSQLGKVHDERQNLHQTLIERNVAYGAVFGVIAVILYQMYQFSVKVAAGWVPDTYLPFDWELGFILAVMLVVKIGSGVYLSRTK